LKTETVKVMMVEGRKEGREGRRKEGRKLL
jgi:hypothetical protein